MDTNAQRPSLWHPAGGSEEDTEDPITCDVWLHEVDVSVQRKPVGWVAAALAALVAVTVTVAWLL